MREYTQEVPLKKPKKYALETVDDLILLDKTQPMTRAFKESLVNLVFVSNRFKKFALSQFVDGGIEFSSINDFANVFDDFFINTIKSTDDKALLISLVEEYGALNQFMRRVFVESNRYQSSERKRRSSIMWPDPTSKYPETTENANIVINNFELIDKTTLIGSAGSCFADEMAYFLQEKKYNYIVEERSVSHSPDKLPNSSAQWGVLFNTPSFMQIAERAFGVADFPPLVDCISDNNGTLRYHDPYRENCIADTPEQIYASRAAHLLAVRRVFEKCEVFIITLGLNECFQNIIDGSIVSRNPKNADDFAILHHKILTVQENINCLQRFLDIIREHNPKFKLIVTVSPVPFLATGRADKMHVITANMHSKSVLRVAAEEFVNKNENVWYFPSYEVVMTCTNDPWEDDLRHVKRSTVERVMKTFERMFVKGVSPDLVGDVNQ
ncbi:GSCFA domain-containing protein [Elstera litoralis]|uniref:GSCFA domain-containing protein n=1 Tax=Elstera litoralis TaxID=552518 RepID=UPI000A040803|nr:GSCFA domain-containing protein [Elstera litoralis]